MKPETHILLEALQQVHDEVRQVRTSLEELDAKVVQVLREKEDGP